MLYMIIGICGNITYIIYAKVDVNMILMIYRYLQYIYIHYTIIQYTYVDSMYTVSYSNIHVHTDYHNLQN